MAINCGPLLPRAKRSWFSNFRSEREKEEVVVVHRDKGFQDLKTSLLQALNVSQSAQIRTPIVISIWGVHR